MRMDKEMEKIVQDNCGYPTQWGVSMVGVYSACEAVLAEQRRRNEAAATQMLDRVRASLEEWPNTGCDIVIAKAVVAIVDKAVAVAREGWVPQSELQEEDLAHEQTIKQRDDAEEALSRVYLRIMRESAEWSNIFGYGDAIAQIEQQLASMVTLEQVDKALKDEWESCQGSHSYTQHRRDVIARLTQQEPTVQEPQVPIDKTDEWEARQVVPLGLVAKTVQQVFHDGYGTGSVCVDEIIKRLQQREPSKRDQGPKRAINVMAIEDGTMWSIEINSVPFKRLPKDLFSKQDANRYAAGLRAELALKEGK